MRELRIVYMGTPDFAVYPLQRLIEAGQNIVAVVTNPDKPAGRGQKIQSSAVKKFAAERGIPVLQPERFRDEQFLSVLRSFHADLQLVVAFKMLPEVVWNMPPLGTVNLHASLLPDYRGAAPINWAIINGDKFSGVTTFLLKHEIDTGNILYRQRVEIGDTTTAGELHDDLMHAGAELLLDTVCAIAGGDYPLIDQEDLLAGHPPRHAPKIFKEDMKIDWNLGIDVIYNHIRGLSPFPAAWTELRHKETGEIVTLKIFAAERVVAPSDKGIGLFSDGKTHLDIRVKGGIIRLGELQQSGKKRMGVEEFLRGFRIAEYTLS